MLTASPLTAELCEGLDGYPTVYYYKDGNRTGQEYLERELDSLLKVVTTLISSRASSEPEHKVDPMDQLHELVDDETQPDASINPAGEVVTLTSETFDQKTRGSPWFVMFHAPWCEHCKRLSPTWEQLGPELRGRVNVGKIDCTANKEFVKRYNIKGFPTLLMIQEPNVPVAFDGMRMLENLKQFALEVVAKPSFKPVRTEEIQGIIDSNEVSFFFAYDPAKTSIESVKILQSVAKTVKTLASIYVSPFPESIDKLGGDKATGVVFTVVRDGGLDKIQYSNGVSGDGASRTALRSWIYDQRHPLVLKLDKATQSEIFESDKKVALAIIDPETESGQKVLASIRQAAVSWKNGKAGKYSDSIRFAWVHGRKYKDYVYSVYGIKPADLPRFIVANPSTEEYYEAFADSQPYNGLESEAIHKALKEVVEGKGTPKATQGFFAKTMKAINRTAVRILVRILYLASRPGSTHHRVPSKDE
eukprot:jgi/Hompol1/1478/HPOL_005608-RA